MQENIVNPFQDLLNSAAGISDPAEQSRKYKTIIVMLSLEAVRSNDHKYIDQAMKIAGLVTSEPSKAYLEIIRAITKMKLKDRNTFDETERITEMIDNYLDKSVALFEIVSAFGKYGIDKNDLKTFSDSLELVQKIPRNSYRASAYRNLSNMLVDTDQEKSRDLIDRSIEILENSKEIEPIFRILAFCETAMVLSKLNDKRSLLFQEKAKALAHELTDDFDRSAAFLKVLETGIEIGIKLKDKKLLDDAGTISKNITKEYYNTLAINALNKYASVIG